MEQQPHKQPPISHLVIPADVWEAQQALEELAGAGLAIHGNIICFEKGLADVNALEAVKRQHEAMGRSLKRLQRMFEKKADFDIFFAQGHDAGYYQGAADTRKAVPELESALASATILVVHPGGRELETGDTIAQYNQHCNDCKVYENDEFRKIVCPVCVIEVARNASILEEQRGEQRA